MARVIDDAGATAAILKPLALPVFEPNALPDPTDRARSLIIINDRHNGELVPRLAISTGAAWLRVSVLSDLGNTSPIDVTPIVERTTREEIARALPAIVERAVPALPAPSAPVNTNGLVDIMWMMNEAIQELSDRLQTVNGRPADGKAIRRLEERLQMVEENAVASVRVEDIKAA